MRIFKLIIVTILSVSLLAPVFAQELKGHIYVSNQTETFDQAKVVREYIVEETAYCTFLIKGFSIDTSGFINLSADIKFIDPQGKMLFEEKNYAQSTISIAQEQKIVALDSSFDISFTQEDLLGMYTLEALIKDNINLQLASYRP